MSTLSAFVLTLTLWSVGARATTWLDELRELQDLHRWQVEEGLLSVDETTGAAALAAMESLERPVGVLAFDRSPTGAIRFLGGLDVAIPISDDTDAAESALALFERYPNLFGVEHPREAFVVRKTNYHKKRTNVHLQQTNQGFPVFGARVVIRLGIDNSFAGLSGDYVPEALLPSEVTALEKSHEGTPGIFHGSLFGLGGWESLIAVPAFKVVGQDETGGPVYRFISAMDGNELHVSRAYFANAPTDAFHAGVYPYALPGNPVRLDSTQTCGTGTYPNCAWVGTAYMNWFWSVLFGNHLNSRYGRDSWDNNEIDINCTPPYHHLSVTADYNKYGADNGVWNETQCAAGIGTDAANCLDILGHEYGHAIQQADMSIQPQDRRHSAALNEGLADVIGEFFEASLAGSGQPDWLFGTGLGCSYTRNLANPAQSFDNDGSPVVQPDHASWFDPQLGESADHFDATIVGKAAHLLGRPASAGAITHWGIPVIGIGAASASLVFYGAINQNLSQNPTFSDFRDGLLDSAADQFGWGGNEYNETLATVDAMGYWTHKYDFGFTSDSRPSMLSFTINSESRHYVFSVENAMLKYRYRTCTYYGLCSWSSSINVDAATNGVSAVIHDGVMWVFWDYNNTIRYKRYYSNGAESTVLVRAGASTSAPPVAVHVAANVLYLLYRESGPFTTAKKVNLMRLDGSIWRTAMDTRIRSRSHMSAFALYGDVHIFYRNDSLDAVFRVFEYSSQLPTSEHQVFSGVGLVDESYGPSVVLYRGRIHLVHNIAWNVLPLDFFSYMRSCEYPCLDDAWTPSVKVDGGLDTEDTWSYLFVADTHLVRADLGTSQPRVMTWRWKNSE